MIKKQYTLYLENRPGALASVLRKLAKEDINIEGISVSESTDVGLVQLVVSKAKKTRRILKDAKIAFTVQDVAVLKLANAPGVLCEGVARLAKMGINISYIYATACSAKKDCDCYAVVSAPDLEAVEQAWSME